ncbi:MAG: SDR family NAD(P)-dependent oxidoreductase [Verrucomicrobiia bacterium]
MKLKDKVAVVTGGTSGMGKAIAKRFCSEGASVVISGRSRDRGNEVVGELTALGHRAEFVEGDVGTIEANRLILDTAKDAFGGVDILVPCAGALCLGTITDTSPDEWKRAMDTNLNSVYFLLHLGIPELQVRGKGSIVAIGSIAAYRAFPGHAAYCASKGALVSLIRQIAIDYSPNVRANVLCPGPVDTPMLRDSAEAFPNPSKAISNVADRTPMKRLGTPEDIAKAALFLACDDSSWIDGTAINIDGGVMVG